MTSCWRRVATASRSRSRWTDRSCWRRTERMVALDDSELDEELELELELDEDEDVDELERRRVRAIAAGDSG